MSPIVVGAGVAIDTYTEVIDSYQQIIDFSPFNKTSWSMLIPDTSASKVQLMDAQTNLDDGAATISYVERQRLPLEPFEAIKTVKRVWVKVKYPGKNSTTTNTVINVYVGFQMNKNDSVTWNGPYPLDIVVNNKIDCFVTGRYISIKFQTTTDMDWVLQGFDLEYDVRRTLVGGIYDLHTKTNTNQITGNTCLCKTRTLQN